MKTKPRADAAHIFISNNIPSLNILGNIKRTRMLSSFNFRRICRIIDRAQLLLNSTNALHHLGKFFCIHGKCRIRASNRSIYNEMFLNNFCTQRNCCHRHHSTFCMVRQSHFHSKSLLHIWNSKQIGLLDWGWVCRSTL